MYTSHSNAGESVFSNFGSKFVLPAGTLREYKEVGLLHFSRVDWTKMALQGYEEVIIPPAKVVPPRATERLITVAELVPLAKGSFPVSYKIYRCF